MTTVSQVQHNGKLRAAALSAVIEDEAGGTFRARLVAQDSTPQGALADLPNQLRAHGFTDLFIDVWQGKHILVVSELNQERQQHLLRLLQEQGLLSPSDVQYNVAGAIDLVKENLRRDSLKWSGRFSMIASGATAAAGWAQKDWNRVFTGAGFALANSLIAIYGNGKGEIDFDQIFRDTQAYMEANGIALPQTVPDKPQRNTFEKIEYFVSRHPVDITYSIGALSGLSNLRSGIGDYQRSGAGISRILQGVIGTSGSAGVVLIPETKNKQQEDNKDLHYYLQHPLEAPKGVFDFVFYSPMRFKGVSSSFYGLLNLTDSFEENKKMRVWRQNGGKYKGSTMQQLQSELEELSKSSSMKRMPSKSLERAVEIRKGIGELKRLKTISHTFWGGKISPYFSAVTGTASLAAAVLTAASSKNRDPSFEQADEYEKMYALAAQSLLPFPKEQRADILQQMATYLSTQKDVEDGEIQASRIIEEVNQRIERLGQSPWLPAQQREQAPAPAR